MQNCDERNRIYKQQELIMNLTEDLLITMEDQGVNKKEIAKRMGKTKPLITQLLNGSRNMTLKTLSDFCYALDVNPEINLVPNEKKLSNKIYNSKKIESKFKMKSKPSQTFKPKIINGLKTEAPIFNRKNEINNFADIKAIAS